MISCVYHFLIEWFYVYFSYILLVVLKLRFCEIILFPASFYDPDILKFLDDSFKLIKEEALQKGTDGSVPVVEFKQPHELQVRSIIISYDFHNIFNLFVTYKWNISLIENYFCGSNSKLRKVFISSENIFEWAL